MVQAKETIEGLLGRKLEMTQLFGEDGRVLPVTVIEVGPCPVLQVKTLESDGYRALQLGFGRTRDKLVSKPQQGHFKKSGVEGQEFVREVAYRGDAAPCATGEKLTVELFEKGGHVDVAGVSKGKGFQGTVKRHKFNRGPETHGSNNVRAPGSNGSNTTPGRTIKGMRRPGHMGSQNKTVMNLEVVGVDAEKNLLFVRGSVPGPTGAFVLVRRSRFPG